MKLPNKKYDKTLDVYSIARILPMLIMVLDIMAFLIIEGDRVSGGDNILYTVMAVLSGAVVLYNIFPNVMLRKAFIKYRELDAKAGAISELISSDWEKQDDISLKFKPNWIFYVAIICSAIMLVVTVCIIVITAKTTSNGGVPFGIITIIASLAIILVTMHGAYKLVQYDTACEWARKEVERLQGELKD